MRRLSFVWSRSCLLLGLSLVYSPSLLAVEGELGQLGFESPVSLKAPVVSQAFRVESIGKMQVYLKISGQGNSIPSFFVEGPLAQNGDSIPVGDGTHAVYKDVNDKRATEIEATVPLEAPGVYRVVLKSLPAPEGRRTSTG